MYVVDMMLMLLKTKWSEQLSSKSAVFQTRGDGGEG